MTWSGLNSLLMEMSRSSIPLQGGLLRLGAPGRLSAHGRSGCSLLQSESITAECARVAAYERLSGSMRLSSGRDTTYLGHLDRTEHKKSSSRGLTLFGKIFGLRKGERGHDGQPGIGIASGEKKVKKRSSWLPDPERRWPVQGW